MEKEAAELEVLELRVSAGFGLKGEMGRATDWLGILSNATGPDGLLVRMVDGWKDLEGESKIALTRVVVSGIRCLDGICIR